MKDANPEMMSRKIGRANVQQAWCLKTILDICHVGAEILCVGSFEDTSCETLKQHQVKITEVDPILNYDLHSYRIANPNKKFDIIYACSVIEHVLDDEQFLEDICCMLKPRWYGLLTCDFNNDWKLGQRLPYTDVRFYTEHDLKNRLASILDQNNCKLVGDHDWSGNPDFEYDGCKYSFATYYFKKEG